MIKKKKKVGLGEDQTKNEMETDQKANEKKGIIDSDDEYRDSETFLQDKLIGNKEVTT